MRTASVMFCCNNPANGQFTGMLAQLSVDDLIQLEGPVADPEDEDEFDGVPFVRFLTAREVTIDNHQFSLAGGWCKWVGNWCWDAADMEISELARLINFLRASGRWTCTEAESSLFDVFNAGKDIPADEIAALLDL